MDAKTRQGPEPRPRRGWGRAPSCAPRQVGGSNRNFPRDSVKGPPLSPIFPQDMGALRPEAQGRQLENEVGEGGGR